MGKKVRVLIVLALTVFMLASCGKKKDLTASDFPLIDEGLSEEELVSQVGKPHEKVSDALNIMSIQADLLSGELSSGSSVMDYEKSWNAISGGDPEKCYIYHLADSDNQAMIAFILDKQVIMITRNPVIYEEE